MYSKKEIGERLNIFAKNFKSKAELARKLNVSPQTLTDYFNGKSAPGESMLLRLEKLGCDIKWLLFGDDDYKENNFINDEVYNNLLEENKLLKEELEYYKKMVLKLEGKLEGLREAFDKLPYAPKKIREQ